jgi:hypothetical protein
MEFVNHVIRAAARERFTSPGGVGVGQCRHRSTSVAKGSFRVTRARKRIDNRTFATAIPDGPAQAAGAVSPTNADCDEATGVGSVPGSAAALVRAHGRIRPRAAVSLPGSDVVENAGCS